jgi:hypothetical protein
VFKFSRTREHIYDLSSQEKYYKYSTFVRENPNDGYDVQKYQIAKEFMVPWSGAYSLGWGNVFIYINHFI